MKTSKTLITTSLTALLASFSLLACGGSEVEPADQSQSAGLAQQEAQKTPGPEAMRHEGRGKHRGPRGGRGFGPPTPEKMVERFDANKNGQLEAAELPERMQERIGDIDVSGDGVVSKDELSGHFKAKFAEHAAKFAERAKERFDKTDKNHDGALDQSEVGAEHWAKLSAADANSDQKLTPDELKAAFESGKIKPPMKRGGQHRHGKTARPRLKTRHGLPRATPARELGLKQFEQRARQDQHASPNRAASSHPGRDQRLARAASAARRLRAGRSGSCLARAGPSAVRRPRAARTCGSAVARLRHRLVGRLRFRPRRPRARARRWCRSR